MAPFHPVAPFEIGGSPILLLSLKHSALLRVIRTIERLRSVDCIPVREHRIRDRIARSKRSGFQFNFLMGALLSAPFPRSEACRTKGARMMDWIPVSKPPDCKPYDLLLLACADGIVWPGFFDAEENEWSILSAREGDDGSLDVPPTHWQPLPEPPKK